MKQRIYLGIEQRVHLRSPEGPRRRERRNDYPPG
ncbi:unnamed protein product [Spirodela intermedia]|uniref:Uncharacterized protein n=2 Tax=Spirodela intermedia TaxID=51605 RepID=A0A7I8ITB4_SPIIN|nr:unnamed protein product [Spirodela intermedia]CAA6661035.1 unnamed protein product [Spirodela intermedia]CAA7397396.1 unnamed protein product [Spirodela intermedia]